MILNLNLGAEAFVPVNQKIVLPQNEVQIAFTSALYTAESVVVQARNTDGETIDARAKMGEPVNIAPLCRKAGAVEVSVALEINGEVAKRWQVDTLVICETPHGKIIVGEIEKMKQDIALLKNAVRELNKIISEVTK